jgi:S-adenosylmethionine synthetase
VSRLAGTLVAELPEMIDAERQVVSEIGAPIEEPNLTLIRLRKGELAMTQDISSGARAIAERESATDWHSVASSFTGIADQATTKC